MGRPRERRAIVLAEIVRAFERSGIGFDQHTVVTSVLRYDIQFVVRYEQVLSRVAELGTVHAPVGVVDEASVGCDVNDRPVVRRRIAFVENECSLRVGVIHCRDTCRCQRRPLCTVDGDE